MDRAHSDEERIAAMTWFFVLLLLAVAIVAGAFIWRTYGGAEGLGLFAPKPERRLAVSEQTSVDGKRRLVLVRRDNVEHLIMIGGPVDVVIETGIGQPRVRTVPSEVVDTPVAFGRAPRNVGHVVNE
jgi:flagellar protein FliO/FliZ